MMSSPYRSLAPKEIASELRKRKLPVASDPLEQICRLELDDFEQKGIPVNYSDWRVKELKRELANRDSPSGFSTLRKDDLIAVLTAHDADRVRDPAASLSARKPLKDIVIDSDSDSSGLDAPPTPSRSSTRRAAPLVASPSSARKAAATPSAERKTRNSARAAASAAAAAAAEPDTEEPPTMFSDPVQWFGLVLRWLANAVNVAGRWMREHKGAVAIVVALLVAFAVAAFVDGAHRHWYREIVTWYGAWIALGFISSAGLGFGAHTFVLFLSPFIVKTMLEANLCQGNVHVLRSGLADGRGWYSHECHPGPTDDTFLDHMRLVGLEALLWGVGTAIGELPPYFFARAASSTGATIDGMESLNEYLDPNGKATSVVDGVFRGLIQMTKRFGALGVFLMASFPNPLFDMAGLLSGYIGMPFWSFFGATLLGKALIKSVVLQTSLLVLVVSNRALINSVINVLPAAAQAPIISYLESLRFESDGHVHEPSQPNMFSQAFNVLIVVVMVGFLVSTLGNMARAQFYNERRAASKKKE